MISLSRLTSWIPLVKPGVLPIAATHDLFNELMRLLLPTLGNPMMPTMIAHLSFLSEVSFQQ